MYSKKIWDIDGTVNYKKTACPQETYAEFGLEHENYMESRLVNSVFQKLKFDTNWSSWYQNDLVNISSKKKRKKKEKKMSVSVTTGLNLVENLF